MPVHPLPLCIGITHLQIYGSVTAVQVVVTQVKMVDGTADVTKNPLTVAPQADVGATGPNQMLPNGLNGCTVS